jgi:hypothetical protein
MCPLSFILYQWRGGKGRGGKNKIYSPYNYGWIIAFFTVKSIAQILRDFNQ